jgi:hypothetical protein
MAASGVDAASIAKVTFLPKAQREFNIFRILQDVPNVVHKRAFCDYVERD